jgi:hypothetical protein
MSFIVLRGSSAGIEVRGGELNGRPAPRPSGGCAGALAGGARKTGAGLPTCEGFKFTGSGTIKTKATAASTVTTSGGARMPGCTRNAAAALRRFVRIRSPAVARAMPRPDSLGPRPILALLRSRRSAARRWGTVRPGSR